MPMTGPTSALADPSLPGQQLQPQLPPLQSDAAGSTMQSAAADVATASGTRPGTNGKVDTTDEPTVKAVSEDLISLLRQHGEEAKETSAVFKKAILQQQEQYQTVFNEMQKVLTAQAQQQKTQKSQAM